MSTSVDEAKAYPIRTEGIRMKVATQQSDHHILLCSGMPTLGGQGQLPLLLLSKDLIILVQRCYDALNRNLAPLPSV